MAEIIHTPLTVMHVIACFFLILVILIQPGKSGGMGILGMRERVDEVSGRLEIDSTPGRGTVIRARVPLGR